MRILSEIADAVLAGRRFEIELGDFLDDFYLDPQRAKVEQRPATLVVQVPNGSVLDAMLAAAAEHLCRRFSLRIPRWVFEPERYLRKPFFALPASAFRATLLLESPMEFRSRNLFVTANAFSRASEFASRS